MWTRWLIGLVAVALLALTVSVASMLAGSLADISSASNLERRR